MRKLFNCLSLLLTIIFIQSAIQAQTTGSIAGTVIDQNGAVVPSATVVIKGASGQEFTASTSSNGTFSVPAVAAGTYTVTVSATDFKTTVVENVKVNVGLPTTVDATLQAGNISETVVVTSGGEVLQTQTATIGTTITGRQITEIPLTSRDALDLVTLLPGTTTVGRPRTSSINGLPKGAISITIDGVDVQDNLLRSSDGFFTYVRPRLDAIDEVTVSTASPGAESSGDGAIQIKFVTRRGTNNYKGSLYWQHRDESLNSNYWFNNRNGLPRNKIRLNQYGGNFGGPIPLFHFGEGGPFFESGKDRAFFFVNYEEFRIPESIQRTRTVLTPEAQQGIFTYTAGGQVRTVNLLQAAATRGFPSTPDPTIASLLAQIRSSLSGGTLTPLDANRQLFDFINPGGQKRYFTAVRVDFNLTKKHSLENVTNYQIFRNSVDFLNGVDPAFPGFPNFGGQDSDRYSNSTALRSTFTQSLINEARFSFLGGMSFFRENLSVDQFANQGGRNLQISAAGITNATVVTSNNRRVSPTFDFSDNVTWLMGAHSLTFGGQYKRIKLRTASINQIVPTIGFTVDTSDPILAANNNFFTTCSLTSPTCALPGASAADVSAAANLYAVLTGRVSSFSGNAYLSDSGTYEFLGDQLQRAKQNTYGLYVQDQWRVNPNLSVTAGLRWQPQEGYTLTSSNFARAERFEDVYGISGPGGLFRPGTLSGRNPQFVAVQPGEKSFETDWNNFAPSVGVVWSPNFKEGIFRGLFGTTGKSVFRGGYSVAFVREGTNVALSILGSNPGGSLPASRSVGAGTLPFGTLLRNPANLVPLSFPSTPAYPIAGSTAQTINVFDPNIKTGNVHSWSVGYQRELDKNTVFEARYVGNRGKDLWRQYSLNELNLIESGLANEFRLAQANLAANNAAGGTRAGSFAYFGPNTGTQPLPNILAYFTGTPTANAGNATLYNSSTLFRNTTFLTLLSPLAPNPSSFYANVQASAARRANALAAGLPANLMVVNPNILGSAAGSSFIGGLVGLSVQNGPFIVDNSNETQYDALVLELRRRFAQGLLVQASYTFSKAFSSAYASSSVVFSQPITLRDLSLSRVPSPFDVRHSFKANWIYELPFGNGKPFFSNINPFTNALVGGWSLIGALRMSSGAPFNLGNVQLVGMTREELQKEVGVYKDSVIRLPGQPDRQVVTFLPVDIVTNTILANNITTTGYSTLGAPSGRFIAPPGFGNCIQSYLGECGFSNLVLYGPKFARLDLSVSKKIYVGEKRNVELRAAFLNALNNPQWRVGGWAADTVTVTNFGSTAFGQLGNGTVYQDTSTTNDPGGRIVELILRINF